MSTVDSLTKMQRNAIDQLRAGDHNEILVEFLVTSVMLELSNLPIANIDLRDYATTVVETLTQHAPIDHCLLGLDPAGLPPVAAAVGIEPDVASHLAELPSGPDKGDIAVEGIVTGTLYAVAVPPPLSHADLIHRAATQIQTGLQRVVEAERDRRRNAVARALSVIAKLDHDWGEAALADIAATLASLPDATGATASAQAARFAGRIEATAGSEGVGAIERTFVVDSTVEVGIVVHHIVEPGDEHVARVDEVLTALTGALERIEQNVRLLAEAETDQLTGIGNRRRAIKALAAAKSMADRQGQPMTVLLCDLDRFKSVNDELGHDVGDRVLARFASLLQQSVRGFDTVTRWGGEEFLVICPTCDQASAIVVAQRLLTGCPEAAAELPESWRQTVSIGVAIYPDTARNPEVLVRAADDALYLAKRSGRDQFQIAPPAPA